MKPTITITEEEYTGLCRKADDLERENTKLRQTLETTRAEIGRIVSDAERASESTKARIDYVLEANR